MKRPTRAVQAFDEALQYCPNDLLALEGAAQIEYARRQPDAIELLQRILAIRPDDITTHAMLASLYRSRKRCKAALPHFEASRALFSSHPQLQQGFSFCLAKTGDYTGAVANYKDVLASHPNDAARYNLAISQWKLHDAKGALDTLQPLLKDRDNETALVLGSRIAEDAGDTPQSVELLRAAIVLQPKNIDNYLNFAQLAFNHNSSHVGIDMLNAGLTQLPDATRLYVARGVMEVQVSQFDRAIADFERAHHLDPQLSLAMDAIGVMQSQQHNSAASLNLFRQQARLHPNDGLLQYLYAEALSESDASGETRKEAIAAAERSVAIDPGYEPAHDLLAVLYLRANQPDRALAEAKMALKIHPADETALYQEIMASRKLHDTSAVRKLVQ